MVVYTAKRQTLFEKRLQAVRQRATEKKQESQEIQEAARCSSCPSPAPPLGPPLHPNCLSGENTLNIAYTHTDSDFCFLFFVGGKNEHLRVCPFLIESTDFTSFFSVLRASKVKLLRSESFISLTVVSHLPCVCLSLAGSRCGAYHAQI